MTHFIDWEARTKVVLAIIAKETTEQESADALGVDIEEIKVWRSMYVDALCRRDSARESNRRPRKSLARIASVVAVVALLTGSVAVYSQQTVACAEPGWPTLLFCFSPNTPASANQVNGNFKQVLSWIETKTGPVADGNKITAGEILGESITTTGTVSAATVSGTTVTANTFSGTTVSAATVSGTNITSTGNMNPSGTLNLPWDGSPVEGISAVRAYIGTCSSAERRNVKVKYGHHTGVWSGDYLCVCVNDNAAFRWLCLR